MICKADKYGGTNYGKPHVWVPGTYDGQPRESCKFCGAWREGANSVLSRGTNREAK